MLFGLSEHGFLELVLLSFSRCLLNTHCAPVIQTLEVPQ